MSVALYVEQHVPRAITLALRLRNVDVLTAQEDNAAGLSDAQLLDRATQLKRVIFTQDDDLLAEAAHRRRKKISFPGIIYAHPLRISIGTCVHQLELIAHSAELKDLKNRIEFLPLI